MYFYNLMIRNSLNDKLLRALFKIEASEMKSDPPTQTRLKQIRSRGRFETLLCKWCRNKKYQKKEQQGLDRIDAALDIVKFLKLQF